jgi:ABC-2 type transport system ATP-binding protein
VLVHTHALTKRYGALTALDGCDLEIPAGEVFGLLGPNGSGKTTLLRLLMGYLRPSAGAAFIASRDCFRESVAVHRQAAYLPGDARLFRPMRGRSVLQFFGGIRGAGYVERALRMSDRLELDLTRVVGAMSTGMRQKLALIATMSADTPLVILDEPTANLDPTARADVLALVREARAEGRTILFSSHVLDEVEKACDRVAILRRGKLVHTQTMADLRRQHRIRARLTGPMPATPANLAAELTIRSHDADLTIETPGELSPLLGWLATLPLAEVQIEPVGLAAIYDRFHPSGGER